MAHVIRGATWVGLMGLGFFVPGYFIASWAGCRARISAAFVISSVVLFEVILLLQVTGQPLTRGRVAAVLIVITLAVAIGGAKGLRWAGPRPARWRPRVVDILLVLPVAGSALILGLRAVMQPLSGYDTSFRWAHLAEEILRTGNLDYYPPLSAADFLHYFYVDAIPPMCQFSYFWLFASAGSTDHRLTAILVIVQYVLIIAFCFRLARRLAGDRSGVFATAVLSTAVIFFWAVVMGQETGLTALSVVATLDFIIGGGGTENERGALLVAAFATALGILAREYGWIVLLCGLAAAVSVKVRRRNLALYLGMATALALPWYLRTWVLTGNPFYSNPIGHLFAVNEVHNALLANSESVFSLSVDPIAKLRFLLFLVKSKALLVVPAGLAGLWVLRRRLWIHVAVIVCTLAWVVTVSRTAGGLFYSTRVLSPVFVLLAVAAGAALDAAWIRGRLARVAVLVVIGLTASVALLQEMIVPGHLEMATGSDWYKTGFRPTKADDWVRPMFEDVPRGSGCLTDWAAVWVVMRSEDIEVVPLWSPQAAVIFDRGLTGREIASRLAEDGIQWVVVSPSVSLDYLRRNSPLYADLETIRPRVISESGTFALFSLQDLGAPRHSDPSASPPALPADAAGIGARALVRSSWIPAGSPMMVTQSSL